MQHLAAVNPDLYADAAIRCLCLGKAVVDVCADGLQRDGSLVIMLRTGDFSAAQAAGNLRFDTLRAKLHRAADGLLECAAEGDAALELGSDALRHELRVEIGGFDLDDIQRDFLTELLFALCLERRLG